MVHIQFPFSFVTLVYYKQCFYDPTSLINSIHIEKVLSGQIFYPGEQVT